MNLAGLLPQTLIDAAEAVGLISSTQDLEPGWFENPLSHIESILTNADQRTALFNLLDQVLPPEPVPGIAPGAKWHPLLGTQAQGNLYLTVNDTVSPVLLGLGGRYGGDIAALRMEVPAVALAGNHITAIAGTAAGPLTLALDVTLNWTRPAHPIALASISVALVYAPAAAPPAETIVIILRGLDLDGSGAKDVTLNPANLGAEASALILGLLREKLEEIAGSAGGEALLVAQHLIPLLGLDGTLPALPFATLGSDPQALSKWLLSLTNGAPPPMTAWLGHLAGLLGLTAPAVSTVTTGKTTVSSVQLLAIDGTSPVTLGLARGVAADGTTPNLGIQIGISLVPGAGPVTVNADITLVAIPLAGQSAARVLPAAALVVQAGGTAPLIAPSAGNFSINAIRAGIGWNGSAIAPLLELDGVVIPAAGSYPTIDLTNANTVVAAAASGLVDSITAGLGSSGAGAALAALAGLVEPASDNTAPLVDFAQLATNPTATIATLHRNALLSAAHPWSIYLAELGTLLGLPGAVSGSGTVADPWTIPLASSGPIVASLAAWNGQTSGNAADPQQLRIALRAGISSSEITLAWSSVLLGADLAVSGPNHTTMFAEHHLSANFIPPAVSAGSTGLSATSLGAEFSLIAGQPAQVSAAINGLAVTTPAGVINIPALSFPVPAGFDPQNPGPALGITTAELENFVAAMLAGSFRDAFGVTGQALAVLLGAGAGAPGLAYDLPSIADAAGGTLFTDPADALRLWLNRIATTAPAAGGEFVTPVVGWLAALLGNNPSPPGVAPDLTTLAGQGTYDAPWQVPLGGPASGAQGLLWFEPAGPLSGAALAAAAVTAITDFPGLVQAVISASRYLGALPQGSDPASLASGLQDLAAYLAASDGVVPLTSQLPSGGSWSSGTALSAAHPAQPADPAAISQLLAQFDAWAAPGTPRTILLLGPAFSDQGIWAPLLAAAEAAHAGSTNPASRFNLRVPGVAPAAIDLRPVTSVSDYYTADLQDDGSGDVAGLVAQLGLVVARLRALRPGAALLLAGHSTAGIIATAYAAANPGAVTGLITLGTPHQGAPLVPLLQVPAANALRALAGLLPDGLPAGPLQDALAHLLQALDGYVAPPVAGALPVPWPYPVADFTGTGSTDTGGAPALALGGQLGGDLLSSLKTALAARIAAVTVAAPTHLAFGTQFALPLGSTGASAVAAAAMLRADIGRLALNAGAVAPARPAQAFTATVAFWRPGGWLFGGPLSYSGGGPLTDIRVRSAQAGLVVSLDGAALQAKPFGTLRDAAFHGMTQAAMGWADASFALALGSAFSSIGTAIPANSALANLVAILQALDIATAPVGAGGAVGIAADALNALTADPLGFLTTRLPNLLTQNLLPGFSASAAGGYACQAGTLPIEAFVLLSPPSFGLRTIATGNGLALGSVMTLGGSVSLPFSTLKPGVALSLSSGPASLSLAGSSLSLAVPASKTTLSLIPAPGAADIKTALTAILPPLLLSSTASALLGGLAAPGNKITGLFSFLESPWDWLTGTGGLGDGTSFDPARLTRLIGMIGPLPAGLTLTATGKNPTLLQLTTSSPLGGVLAMSAGVSLDSTGHATPAVTLTLDTPTSGSWPSVGVSFGVSGSGISLTLAPSGLTPIQLLPNFDGAAALAGAAKKLLPEALDALVTALAPGPKPPLVALALDTAAALSLYDSAGGFSAHADALAAMLGPGWFASLSSSARTAFLTAASAYFNDPSSPLHAALPGTIAVSGSSLTWNFAAPVSLGSGTLSLAAGWDAGGSTLSLGVTNFALAGAPLKTTLSGGFANGTASLTGGLGLSLQSSLGISAVPQLAFSFGAGAPSLALLPLGAGTASTLALQFAPSFAFTHASGAPAQLVEDWVLPLAADLLIGATGTDFSKPLYTGGPTIETLLANAQLINIGAGPAPQKYTLKTPLPALDAVLASLLQSLPTVPITLVADPPLTLLLGNAGGKLGAGLQGTIAISNGPPAISLKFGQPGDAVTVPGIALDLFTTGGTVTFAPSLNVRGIGVEFAGGGSTPLFSSSGFRIGDIDGFIAFQFNLANGQFSGLGGGLEIGQLGLPLNLLDSVSGGNPVAASLLGSNGGAGGDSSAVNPAIDIEVTYLGGTLAVKFSGTTQPIVIPIHASFGTLYIDQLDLSLNGTNSVAIGIDGSLTLGGLSVGVDELGVLIPIPSILKPGDWSLDLQGLAVAFDSGPVEISGGLRKNPGPPIEYDGMLSAMITGLGLTIVGAYSRPTDAQGAYTSLFLFVSLPIPLGGPPFAFVTGLGGGFGYNRELIVPADMNEIPSFVLVEAIDGTSLANDPMNALMQMSQSIPPRRGALWIAAGVRLTSFSLVNSIVVVSVALDNGLDIEILGVSRMALPTEDVALISVELALRVRFDTAEQILSVQAQLTDNSYLFSKDCQLTGGFALAIWYGDGQFVISLGGYNPIFSKPAKFPDVPRLGFNWSVSSIIVIKGGAYFALTNSCVMAGGSLSATASIGPISAWFDCYVDFLISWDPFAYEFDIGVEIGVSLSIEICFFGCVTIGISISTGAQLMIAGPPFHGTAAIDAYVTTVHVSFGDPPAPPPYITDWNVFAGKYLTAGDPHESAVSIQFNTGLLPSDPPGAKPQPGTQDQPWQVGSEFSLTTTTRMPAESCPVVLFGANVTVPGGLNKLDLAAMDRLAITSKHNLVLRQKISGQWSDPVINDGNNHFTITAKAGFFPEASWHWCDPQHLPAAARTISAIAGFTFDAHVVLNNQSALIPISTLVADEPQYALPLPFATTLALVPGFKSYGAAAALLATAVAGASSAQMLAASAAILSGANVFADNRAAIGLPPAGLAPLASQALRKRRAAPPLLTPLTTGLTMEPPGLPAPRLATTIAPVGAVLLAAPRLRAVLQYAAAPAADTAPAQRTTVNGLQPALLRAAPRMSPPGRLAPAAIAGARLIIVPAAAAPRPTRIALPARALRHADFGAAIGPAHQAALDQAAADLLGAGVTLGAGAAHIWDVPDDQGQFIITSTGTGMGAVRMVCMDRGGAALRDLEFVAAGSAVQKLPAGTAMVAIQCLGALPAGALAPATGFGAITGQFAPAGRAAALGWQAASTLVQTGPSRFLARGARLRIVRPHATRRNGQRASFGMPRAADVVNGQFGIETSLQLATGTVMIALDSRGGNTAGTGDLALAAAGATLATAPQRIVTGGRRLLLYDVTGRDAKAAALVVSVSSLADYQISGVAGLRGSAAEWANRLAAGVPDHFVDDTALSPDGALSVTYTGAGA